MRIGPDLTITALTAPDVAGAGAPLTVGDTTRNQDAGTAPASTTSYYLSANTALDASDTLLGSRGVAPLGPGASDAGSAVVTIPAGTSPGTWYLIARADAANVVPESNELNNTYARALRIGPDLTVSALTSPTTAGAGGTLSVTETTRNAGGGASAASITRYYLSVDWQPRPGPGLSARTVPAARSGRLGTAQ